MGTKKNVRDHVAAARRMGAEVVAIRYGGHCHLTLSAGGCEKVFHISGTPSDARSKRNFESNVRQWMREIANGQTGRQDKAEVHPSQRQPVSR